MKNIIAIIPPTIIAIFMIIIFTSITMQENCAGIWIPRAYGTSFIPLSPYKAYNEYDIAIEGEVEELIIKNCPDPSITAIKIKVEEYLKGDGGDHILVDTSEYYTLILPYNTDYIIDKNTKILAFIEDNKLIRGWFITDYEDANVLLNDFGFMNDKTIVNMTINKERISIPLLTYHTFNDLINNSIYSINGEIVNASSYSDNNISIAIEPITYADSIDVIIDAKREGRYQMEIYSFSNTAFESSAYNKFKIHTLIINVER